MQLMHVCLFTLLSFTLLWSADDGAASSSKREVKKERHKGRSKKRKRRDREKAVVITGINSLCQAVRKGELENVRAYLSGNKDQVNAQDEYGSPLIYAIDNGSLDMTALLLQNGADVNMRMENGCTTPLKRAIASVDKNCDMHHERMQVMNLLLLWGAIPGIRQDLVHGKCQPLLHVSTLGEAKLLHWYGADINELLFEHFQSPLMYHVQMCNEDIVHYLLQQGVHVNEADGEENALCTARTFRTYRKSYDVVHAMGRWLLQAGAPILDMPKQGSKAVILDGIRHERKWQGYAYDKALSDCIAKSPRIRCLRNMALDVIRVHAPKDIEMSEQADLLWRDMFQYKDEVEDIAWPQGYAPLQLPYGFEPQR